MIQVALDGFPAAPVERASFGTADATAIARLEDAFLRRELGAGIATPTFYVASSGCVLGAELDDGRRVVVKNHQPNIGAPVLAAIQRVQRHLAAHGFPAPAPLAGPAPLAAGVAVVESMLEGGITPDATTPHGRRALAGAFHRFLVLAAPLAGEPALTRRVLPRAGSVFPTPHSPVFDFDATTAGAEWIESLAAAAAAIVARDAGGPPVLTHVDFRAEHLRMDGDVLVALYDWDSLRTDYETVAVGQAAQAFTVDWTEPVAHIPTLDEVVAFVEDYEGVRGRLFDEAEWRVVRAAWVYATAYGARCEHALLGSDVDPVPEAFRDRLAAHGADWLR